MPYPDPFGPATPAEAIAVDQARAAAAVAMLHRVRHDREGTFPVEGLAALAESGYLALVVPSGLGGPESGVAPMTLSSAEIARGDPSLALALSQHTSVLGRTRDAQLWPEATFARITREVVTTRSGAGALINTLATEPDLGSPSRGGLPLTRAERTPEGWRISGQKTFATGSAVLRWGIVSAAAEGPEGPRAANFIVPMDTPGIHIEPTWDSLGMRATASHTVVFRDVLALADAEVPRPGSSPVPFERAWSLVVAAVYLGAAEAARDLAMDFARTRRPTALAGKPISSLPHIRARAGRMDLLLYQARGLLVSTARLWDQTADPASRAAMDGALAAAKVTATNLAVEVADHAMRLVGGSSLDRHLPLEQFFRDVRGGLNHPPQDDLALEILARQALDEP